MSDMLEGEPPIPGDEEEVEVEVEEGAELADGSLISQLRARHEEIRTKQYHLDLPVPGYNNLMWVRFRPFRVAKQEKRAREIARKFERGEEVMLDASIQTLIDGCSEVMLLPQEFNGDKGDEGENLKSIDDAEPIRFDARLNEVFQLGVEPPPKGRARDIVISLFPTEQGILQMSRTVTTWLNDVTKDADEAWMGE
jgi:hypothetical protein